MRIGRTPYALAALVVGGLALVPSSLAQQAGTKPAPACGSCPSPEAPGSDPNPNPSSPTGSPDEPPRGRGEPPPSGTPVPPPTAPTPRRLAEAQDPSTWDLWWEHNRDPYLALGAALLRLHPQTEVDDGSRVDPLSKRRAGLTWDAVYAELVPRIALELESSRDSRVMRSALLALARIGEAREYDAPDGARQERVHIATVITPFLDDAHRGTAETAVIALGVLGSPEAIRILADIAEDTRAGRHLTDTKRVPVRTRALACYGLGVAASYVGAPETSRFAVHHLARVLASEAGEYPDVQAACAIALGLVPLPRGKEDRTDLTDPENPSVSWPSLVEYLLARLTDVEAEDMVRAHSATALARVVHQASDGAKNRAAEALLHHSDRRSEDSADVRRSCLVALGALGDSDDDDADRRIRAALREAVDGPDQLARNFAVIGLAQVAARPGSGKGAPLASEKDVAGFLLDQVSRGARRLRPWAAVGLGLLGHGLREQGLLLGRGPADALLSKVRETRSPSDGAAYSLAIGLNGDVRGLEDVHQNLDRFLDDEHRGHVAVALGLMGNAQALAPLKATMAGALHKPELMEQAAIARALLGDAELIPELIARLDECRCWLATWGVTRGLAWTADHRALEPLARLLDDERRSDAERALVIDALGWICDKERVIWDSRISAGLNYTAAPQTLTDPLGFGILDTL